MASYGAIALRRPGILAQITPQPPPYGGGEGEEDLVEDNINGTSSILDDYAEFGAAIASVPDLEESFENSTLSLLTHLRVSTLSRKRESGVDDVKMAAVLLCGMLGALSIVLNVFVIVALLRNRRRVLRNVFYVLVFHCSLVDVLRGGCLISWGMPHLLIGYMRTMDERLTALKINQFTLVILRSCNLLTIFNLLLFTMNEFIVISFPLHYRRRFRRRTVLAILAVSWLVSLLFGVGSIISSSFLTPRSSMVMVRRGDGSWVPLREEGSSTAAFPVNVLSMLMIFVLCYLCLFTVLVCYGWILHKIRQFHSMGTGRLGQPERRSLYQTARPHHHCRQQPDRRCRRHDGSLTSSHQSQGSAKSVGTIATIKHLPLAPAASVVTNYSQCNNTAEEAGAKKRWRNRSDCSEMSAPDDGRRPRAAANGGGECGCGGPNRCNSHRKWKSHLMSRHKYLIVISSVLLVDILFLLPYSAIQMVALLHLNNVLATSSRSVLVRWALQLLIGVHSVCQPLCYFRMNEFRRLACCWTRKRRGAGSVTRGQTAATTFRTPLLFKRHNSARSLNRSQTGTEQDYGVGGGRETFNNNSTALEFAEIIEILNEEPTTTAPIGDLTVTEMTNQAVTPSGPPSASKPATWRITSLSRRIESIRRVWRIAARDTKSEDLLGAGTTAATHDANIAPIRNNPTAVKSRPTIKYRDDEEDDDECSLSISDGDEHDVHSEMSESGAQDGGTLRLPRQRLVRETALCSPFLKSNWSRVGSVGFRSYGSIDVTDHQEVGHKLSGLSGLRSNSVFEEDRPELDELSSEQGQHHRGGAEVAGLILSSSDPSHLRKYRSAFEICSGELIETNVYHT